jgi:hypothetical protein
MRVEPYTLQWYTARAKERTQNELAHAVKDISATLPLYRDRDTRDPYVAKLLAEMDAYTVEMIRRRRLVK